MPAPIDPGKLTTCADCTLSAKLIPPHLEYGPRRHLRDLSLRRTLLWPGWGCAPRVK